MFATLQCTYVHCHPSACAHLHHRLSRHEHQAAGVGRRLRLNEHTALLLPLLPACRCRHACVTAMLLDAKQRPKVGALLHKAAAVTHCCLPVKPLCGSLLAAVPQCSSGAVRPEKAATAAGSATCNVSLACQKLLIRCATMAQRRHDLLVAAMRCCFPIKPRAAHTSRVARCHCAGCAAATYRAQAANTPCTLCGGV